MIEIYENALQTAVLIVCVILAAFRALKSRNRAWTLLSLAYGSWLLGDIYWMACLLFYDKTPQIPLISDLSWYAACTFLYMLLRQVSPPEEAGPAGRIAWLGPVFTMGMAVFYMTFGQIISNLAYAGLMGLLLYSSIRRLAARTSGGRAVPLLLLVFCLLEYGLWTSSCFWTDVLIHPYYVFDVLVTAVWPVFLHAVRKAVTE